MRDVLLRPTRKTTGPLAGYRHEEFLPYSEHELAVKIDCPASNENTVYRVTLEFLWCTETTDYGNDEPYLVVTGRIGGDTTHVLGSVSSSSFNSLGPIFFEFTGSVSIALYESDSSSADDYPGTVYIVSTAGAANHLQERELTDGTGIYSLAYRFIRVTL